ncbi:MAG: hypothetical protein ABR568_22820 [Pyrinomonadaceae bacterium]
MTFLICHRKKNDFAPEWWIQFAGATVEFVFAPEERDVYSYERAPEDLAPLGAKPAAEQLAEAGKDDCAPTELRGKERTVTL